MFSTESTARYGKLMEEELTKIIERNEDMVIEIMLKRLEFAEGLDNLIQSRIKMLIDGVVSPESVAHHILKDGLEDRLRNSLLESVSRKSAYEIYKKIKENSPEAADKRYYRAIKRALIKEVNRKRLEIPIGNETLVIDKMTKEQREGMGCIVGMMDYEVVGEDLKIYMFTGNLKWEEVDIRDIFEDGRMKDRLEKLVR